MDSHQKKYMTVDVRDINEQYRDLIALAGERISGLEARNAELEKSLEKINFNLVKITQNFNDKSKELATTKKKLQELRRVFPVRVLRYINRKFHRQKKTAVIPSKVITEKNEPAKDDPYLIVKGNGRRQQYIENSENSVFFNDIAELTKGISASNGSSYYSRSSYKIGIIADDFLYDYYGGVAELIYLYQDNYKEIIDRGSLDFILWASVWFGIREQEDYKGLNGRVLSKEILQYARAKGIKVLFQSIEDPPHYKRFLDLAMEADYIFTSDYNIISDYKIDTQNLNVFYLGHGANPLIDNPIGFLKRKRPAIKDKYATAFFFAGGWHQEYISRCENMKIIFNHIIDKEGYRLIIADRDSDVINGRVWPNRFREYCIPSIDKKTLRKVQKLFDFNLAFNSVKNSPTMASMRMMELQSLGTLIVSDRSPAVENIYSNAIIIDAEGDFDALVGVLTENDILKLQLDQIRNVFSHHTNFAWFEYICGCIGLDYVQPAKTVRILYDEYTDDIKESIESQTYEPIEAIPVSEVGRVMDTDGYAIIMSDRLYCEYYIEDMINAFKFVDVDYVNCEYDKIEDAYDYSKGKAKREDTMFDLSKVNISRIADGDVGGLSGFAIIDYGQVCMV